MTKLPFRRYFEARLRSLAALSDAAIHPHPGEAGKARELLVSDFLRAHLPPALCIGEGMVFGKEWSRRGSKDGISTQQDVIIYRQDFPTLEVGGVSMFFRESVVSTIEVKTNHVSSDLEKVFEKAASVLRVEPAHITTYQVEKDAIAKRQNPSRPVLCGVFVFRGLARRSRLVGDMNRILDLKAAPHGDLSRVHGPDFVFSPEAGLIVRNSRFHTLADPPNLDQATDGVCGRLTDAEKRPYAYRRAFTSKDEWKGLPVIILELAERCQRYAVSYTNLSEYL